MNVPGSRHIQATHVTANFLYLVSTLSMIFYSSGNITSISYIFLVDYTDWHVGQPNNIPNQDCLEVKIEFNFIKSIQIFVKTKRLKYI